MNAHEQHARYRKADSIASLLLAAHSHIETDIPASEIAAGMNEQEQLRAAVAAGERAPSDVTWDLVCELLRKRERVSADVSRSTVGVA